MATAIETKTLINYRAEEGVAIIEMKVESELFPRWFPNLTATALALLGHQKLNWYRFFPFPQVLANNLYICMNFC